MSHLLRITVLSASCLLTLPAIAQMPAAGRPAIWEMVPGVPDATHTDPVSRGVMKGNPPPTDKRVQFRDGSAFGFPGIRWSLSHWREIVPTKAVSRGNGPVIALPRTERSLDDLKFKTTSGIETTFKSAIDQMYTDGLLILHRGRIVYETYRGEGKAERPHISFSVTKSFVGLIAAVLVTEERLDPNAPVVKYVPELKESAYGDATVRNVMDMTVAAHFSENYADPGAEIRNYAFASGLLPATPEYTGPRETTSFLPTVKKEGEHGYAFHYMSINAEALTWIVSRATGKSLTELLSELIWSKIGAESDAYISVDGIGTEAAGTGLSTTLRDLARFGEMMRNKGKVNGKQVVSTAALDEILKPATDADRAAFDRSGYDKTLSGWTYRDMWWITNNSHGAYSARGIYGQGIYIDPKAEMVVVRYASMPAAGNAGNDPLTLPFYNAVADALSKDRK